MGMLALAQAALLQTGVPALAEHRIANIFRPLATPADSEYKLALFVLSITGAIFVIVGGLLLYAMIRFRRKPGDDARQEPPQVYGSNQIEVAWTVIPILIVFILLGVTVRMIGAIQDAQPGPSALRATIVGHQWWWEIHYPDLGITTANEFHVPVADASGHATFMKLESMDVIHSFWVPQLSGKTDLIPNRDNALWFDPREPGVYLGNCAEYCGQQHANMLLRVIVHREGDFEKWAAAQSKPAEDDPAVSQGKAMFESLSCVSCHTVRGTSAKGDVGPDLTHLMSRETIGSGVLPNTPKNLRDWVKDPQAIKPGCLMPSMRLNGQELDQVVAYHESLK